MLCDSEAIGDLRSAGNSLSIDRTARPTRHYIISDRLRSCML